MGENGNGYKRPKVARLPNLTFDVETAGEGGRVQTVHFETLHPWRYEYEALPELLVGEVERGVTDPSGRKLVREARLYLKHLLVKLEGVDAAEMAEVGGDPKAYLDLPGNEDLAFLGYTGFLRALAGAYSKSRDADPGAADGGGDGAPQGGAAGAPLSGV